MGARKAIILDLGNVIFTWTERPKGIPLKDMMKTATWAQHQCGHITDEECYNALGTTFAVPAATIRSELAHARASLTTNHRLVETIRSMKDAQGLALYAMSNIAREDIDYLRVNGRDGLAIFNDIFPSGAVGFRKPDERFYRHVLEQIGLAPDSVVFVDDSEENVCAARHLGMKGLIFRSTEDFYDQLSKVL